MTVGNGIQLAHPTVGGREIKLQFIKISSDEALIWIWIYILVCRWIGVTISGKKAIEEQELLKLLLPLTIHICSSQAVQPLKT